MRTTYPVLVVLAIGIASIMFGLSGVGAMFDGADAGADGVGGQVEDRANDSEIQDAQGDGVDTDLDSSSDLVGIIIDSATSVLDLVVLVATLPVALRDVGFPTFMAYPLGICAQIIASVGFIQFLSGRTLK